MKVYKCDSCGEIITDPYSVKMKEFYIGVQWEDAIDFPVRTIKKAKIDLCDNCFKNLKNIAINANKK